MKGLNWNEIIKSPCLVSSLNETLLRVIRDKVSMRMIGVRTSDKPWFNYRCVCGQDHRVKQTQSNFFAAGCKLMQHYVTNLYNIMQHYVIRGDITPHFHRLIAVNSRFCGNNLIGI